MLIIRANVWRLIDALTEANYSFCKAYSIHLHQGSATYGPRAGFRPPSKIIRPAALSENCSNCMARLAALYFMNLPSLQLLALNTYKELLIRNRTML